MKRGDKVKRRPPPEKWGNLRRGHQYFGLAEGEVGTVEEVHDDYALIREFGGWPHALETLEVMDNGEDE